MWTKIKYLQPTIKKTYSSKNISHSASKTCNSPPASSNSSRAPGIFTLDTQLIAIHTHHRSFTFSFPGLKLMQSGQEVFLDVRWDGKPPSQWGDSTLQKNIPVISGRSNCKENLTFFSQKIGLKNATCVFSCDENYISIYRLQSIFTNHFPNYFESQVERKNPSIQWIHVLHVRCPDFSFAGVLC